MKKIVAAYLTFLFLAVVPFSSLVRPVYAAIENPVLQEYGHDQEGAQSGSLLNRIISMSIAFMMLLAVLLVLLNFVEAAINWIGSGGDSSKIQKARDKIVQAVIGIVILSATFAIWSLVKQFLGIELDFSILFPENSGS